MSKEQSRGNLFDAEGGFKQDANIQAIIFRQLDRKATAHTMGDEAGFENALFEIMAQLPDACRLRIRARINEYHHTEAVWTGNPLNGWVLSSDPQQPVIINNRGDWDYDKDLIGTRHEYREDLGERSNADAWVTISEKGGPHWVSPIMDIKEVWDYNKLNELIMDELVAIRATWRLKPTEEFRNGK